MQWQRLLGGISGAISIGASVYGAHGLKDVDPVYRNVYETGSRYHLLHSVLLVAAPAIAGGHATLAAKSAGAFLTTGIVLFSGSCYVVGLKEDRSMGKAAPFGGASLICGWLSLALLRR